MLILCLAEMATKVTSISVQNQKYYAQKFLLLILLIAKHTRISTHFLCAEQCRS